MLCFTFSPVEDWLPGKIFLKAYFVINDFSDVVFPNPDALEFLKTGHVWVLGANNFWGCTFRFSNSKDISLAPDKV